MAVLFITQTALEEASLINENVDMKLLKPTIITVQDMQIHTTIGTGLYEELKTQITANTVTALNKTLLDNYIQPAIVWWCMYEAPVNLSYKFMNKSVVKRSSENSDTPAYDELISVANKYKDKAEWYTKRLFNYLCEHSSDYPLFDNAGEGIDIIEPTSNVYNTGMMLDFDNSKPTSLKYNSPNGQINGDGCCDWSWVIM